MRAPSFAWLALLLVVSLFFSPFLFGYFYGSGDMRDVFIPLELFFSKQERQFHLPSWNSDISWGFPVIASAQVGFFYPPLLLVRFLPLWFYLPLIVWLHFLFLATGFYLFLRRCGRSEWASYFGALSFSLGTFVLQHLTHLNILLVIAWLPWQLVVAYSIRDTSHFSWSRLTILGTAVGLPFLAGQLQIPLLMALVTAIFLFFTWSAVALYHRAAAIALIGLLAFGLAAAQLLPTLELIRFSSRGPQGDFSIERANQHSYPLYHLPTVFFPYFYGNDSTYWGKRLEIEYGCFIGTIPLLIALGTMRQRWRDWALWLAIITATFLLALGNFSPLRLVGLEPSLWFFSGPARWLLFTTFGLAVLAAHGFDLLEDRLPRIIKIAAWVILIGVLITNVLLLTVPVTAITYFATTPHAVEKVEQLFGFARQYSVSLWQPYTWVPLLALLLIFFATPRRYMKTAILVATTVELLLVGWQVSPLIPWSMLLNPPDILAALPATLHNKEARIISVRDGGDTGAYFTDPSSRATTATRQQQKELLVPLIHSQYDLPGVEWPASLDLQPHAEALEKLRAGGSYAITNSRLASELNIGAIVAPPSFSPPSGATLHSQTALVSVYTYSPKPRISIEDEKKKIAGTVRQEVLRPTHLALQTKNSGVATLVIRDTWYPGWRATLDGQPIPIEPYGEFFQSIRLPAGTHQVELFYQSKSIVAGLILSGLTVLGCMLVLAFKYA